MQSEVACDDGTVVEVVADVTLPASDRELDFAGDSLLPGLMGPPQRHRADTVHSRGATGENVDTDSPCRVDAAVDDQ
ncbi:hypothetical protein [Halomarina ordinaria]|uniref:Uncharacterized protein n=1 Tax=Halomarina ordinaria TaxID=3033939 RepID=A0ABD5UFA4_9EURY|nr:hypothetical protein [Halomarina sp. PSRA2]